MWVSRRVGLLDLDSPASETLAIGLASGLVVLTACWAAVGSGGRSAFTPVAAGFVTVIAYAVLRPGRRPRDTAQRSPGVKLAGPRWLATLVVSAAFVVATALLFGAILAPVARDGAQPIVFRDPAFYALLASSLGSTGTESITPPSGFATIPGLPTQMWYHWGDVWLAVLASAISGVEPFRARNLVTLPVLLLAAVFVGGTIVRRLTNPSSYSAFGFGVIACLLLAPVPLLAAPLFGHIPFTASITAALLYGINTYGVAAVAALLGMHLITVLGSRPPSWTLAGFSGCLVAFVLPAHLAIAVLGMTGVGIVVAVNVARSLLATRHAPAMGLIWRRTTLVAVAVLAATFAWGSLTGHGLPVGAGSSGTGPFNAAWQQSVMLVVVGAGAFLAIPGAWLRVRGDGSIQADLYLGVLAIVVGGAIGWGLRDPDFNMFYLFYAGIAVYATPVAAVAAWWVWTWLRESGRHRLAVIALIICAAQIELGVGIAVLRLQLNGPTDDGPIPVALIEAIAKLPAGTKVAYACRPLEEATYGTPNLGALAVYTGHAVVPMCFEADVFGAMAGASLTEDRPNGDSWAPQKTLYPAADTPPSSEAVAAFMRQHGIDYVFISTRHPDTLVADAVTVVAIGEYQVLRLP